MLFDQSVQPINFFATEAAAILQSNRLQPKLGEVVIALDMHMRRLIAITRIKEKPVRANSQNGRHFLMPET